MLRIIFKLFYPAFTFDKTTYSDHIFWYSVSLLLVVTLGLLLVFPINIASATSGVLYGVYVSLLRVILFMAYGVNQIKHTDESIPLDSRKRAFAVWIIVWMAGITAFESVGFVLFGFIFITIFTASNLVQLLKSKGDKKDTE
jgi:hypothetical protein